MRSSGDSLWRLRSVKCFNIHNSVMHFFAQFTLVPNTLNMPVESSERWPATYDDGPVRWDMSANAVCDRFVWDIDSQGFELQLPIRHCSATTTFLEYSPCTVVPRVRFLHVKTILFHSNTSPKWCMSSMVSASMEDFLLRDRLACSPCSW